MNQDTVGYQAWAEFRPPLESSEVHVKFNRQDYDRRVEPEIEPQVQATWQERLSNNPHLFDALKFRLAHIHVLENKQVELGMGISSYGSFLGTNRNPDDGFVDKLRSLGTERFNDPTAFFANPLGCTAVVLTKDGYFPLLKRSSRAGEFAGWWNLPGGMFEWKESISGRRQTNQCFFSGHSEPSHVGIKDTTDSASVDKAAIVKELFDAMRAEVHEELNLPLEKLGNCVLLGVVQEQASRLKPSLVFEIQLNEMTAADLARCFMEGIQAKEEHTELVFLSHKALLGDDDSTPLMMYSKSEDGMVAATHEQGEYSLDGVFQKMVPSTLFAFEYLKQSIPVAQVVKQEGKGAPLQAPEPVKATGKKPQPVYYQPQNHTRLLVGGTVPGVESNHAKSKNRCYLCFAGFIACVLCDCEAGVSECQQACCCCC